MIKPSPHDNSYYRDNGSSNNRDSYYHKNSTSIQYTGNSSNDNEKKK